MPFLIRTYCFLGGKPITPTEENFIKNREAKHEDNGLAVTLEATTDQIHVSNRNKYVKSFEINFY